MRLFGLKTCDTCRKALKSLRDAGHEVEFIDLRADGVPQGVVERFHDAFGEELVNRRSTTWRELSDAERDDEAVPLIVAHPSVMKRPVIEDDMGGLYLGWTADVQSKLIG
ncbi:putative reductase [Rhodobacteraceae bacterium THAF1]|uniref:arsenate reductase family protein n=1 Tax=Palleronia sp. THAF1 TaxID=2587842 RepID=UPI000F415452|nr:ArsC/Spx/MgsR family protein [Palleronia sp. THAF1]QFU09405.1 putative reductase [Palleronia sp. THAF1]VDC21976.1 putative reductase [Rhodobacteraceae bacterium THAF1]